MGSKALRDAPRDTDSSSARTSVDVRRASLARCVGLRQRESEAIQRSSLEASRHSPTARQLLDGVALRRGDAAPLTRGAPMKISFNRLTIHVIEISLLTLAAAALVACASAALEEQQAPAKVEAAISSCGGTVSGSYGTAARRDASAARTIDLPIRGPLATPTRSPSSGARRKQRALARKRDKRSRSRQVSCSRIGALRLGCHALRMTRARGKGGKLRASTSVRRRA